MNQCWNIVNSTHGNKFQWNVNRNSYIFIQENAFENVVCKRRPFCLGLNVLYYISGRSSRPDHAGLVQMEHGEKKTVTWISNFLPTLATKGTTEQLKPSCVDLAHTIYFIFMGFHHNLISISICYTKFFYEARKLCCYVMSKRVAIW